MCILKGKSGPSTFLWKLTRGVLRGEKTLTPAKEFRVVLTLCAPAIEDSIALFQMRANL